MLAHGGPSRAAEYWAKSLQEKDSVDGLRARACG